jgi:hypothetical protein
MIAFEELCCWAMRSFDFAFISKKIDVSYEEKGRKTKVGLMTMMRKNYDYEKES